MHTLDGKYDIKALCKSISDKTLPERINSRSFQTSLIEENPQTNTNEDSVKTLLEQSKISVHQLYFHTIFHN
jgi:hypothetical protein